MLEMIQAWDTSLLFGIHEALSGPLMDRFILGVTAAANSAVLWGVLAALGLWSRKYRWAVLMAVVAAGLALGFGDGMLKHLVERVRPCFQFPGVEMLVPYPKTTSYSFPSGHSISFFAAATAFLLQSRDGLGKLFLAFAALVAFSRVYLFMHFPGDVLAGACLGMFWGVFVTVAAAHLEKKKFWNTIKVKFENLPER